MNMYTDTVIEMFVDMCAGMYADTGIDEWLDIYAGFCVAMCTDSMQAFV